VAHHCDVSQEPGEDRAVAVHVGRVAPGHRQEDQPEHGLRGGKERRSLSNHSQHNSGKRFRQHALPFGAFGCPNK